jgi:hypothetical protein
VDTRTGVAAESYGVAFVQLLLLHACSMLLLLLMLKPVLSEKALLPVSGHTPEGVWRLLRAVVTHPVGTAACSPCTWYRHAMHARLAAAGTAAWLCSVACIH